MAGIYLHIPFCKQACTYCNFHFSTSLRSKNALIDALVKEIELQANYLNGATIETIYFGGGTPSLLSATELNVIFSALYKYHIVDKDAEITLEANPDDLTEQYLNNLRDTTPINRLSIGIQSFVQADLAFMNRAHRAEEGKKAIELAQSAGFHNLTVDLIYGSPMLSDAQWAENLATVFAYDIPHISCYCLTVEPKTALYHAIKKGTTPNTNEEQAARQMEYLMNAMRKAGYEQYEISNFAQPGYYARHNSNYWLGVPYLGIGPSAHAFDGRNRQWNIANNATYIAALQENKLPTTIEMLTSYDRYNEYVMTSLRTTWGCQLSKIETMGVDFSAYFMTNVLPFVVEGTVIQSRNKFTLSDEGRLLADHITASLFWVVT